jgi:hypothetical protein
MKINIIAISVTTVFLLAVLAFTGCDIGGSDDAGGTPTYTVLYDATKDVLPSYGAVSTAMVRKTVGIKSADAWGNNGNTLYELYGVLEDDPDTMVGYFNIFDSLKAADMRFSGLMSSGNMISQTPVSAPAGTVTEIGAQTYDMYHKTSGVDNGEPGSGSQTYAKRDGDNLYLLSTNTIDKTGSKTKSVIQGTYNETTGDVVLEMFMANYVFPGHSQGGEGWETVKAHISGNTGTHTFTVNIIRDGSGYDHQITGHGVSQGTGYFLMKIKDGNHTTFDAAADKYYAIDAAAAVADLAAKSAAKPDGDPDAAAAGDTAGYAASPSFPTVFPFTQLPDSTGAEALDLTLPELASLGPITQ